MKAFQPLPSGLPRSAPSRNMTGRINVPGNREVTMRPTNVSSNNQESGQASSNEVRMVRLEGETSNALFEILAEWNDHLKDTDLEGFDGPKP